MFFIKFKLNYYINDWVTNGISLKVDKLESISLIWTEIFLVLLLKVILWLGFRLRNTKFYRFSTSLGSQKYYVEIKKERWLLEQSTDLMTDPYIKCWRQQGFLVVLHLCHVKGCQQKPFKGQLPHFASAVCSLLVSFSLCTHELLLSSLISNCPHGHSCGDWEPITWNFVVM